uniref:Uncharacterized protein n=1 Tax=Mesocestoides corti TaxID=53468 RepID=A0A5K3G241_MESCO
MKQTATCVSLPVVIVICNKRRFGRVGVYLCAEIPSSYIVSCSRYFFVFKHRADKSRYFGKR